MPKKQPKKAKPTSKGQAKAGPGNELSDDQLKGVAGGVAGGAAGGSSFRSVGGLKRETEIVEFGDSNSSDVLSPANPFSKR